MALVVLSKIEQRLDAVRAVLAGADVTAVAAQLGVHRSSVHRWTARYLTDQLTGLVDRSHRPASCPHQAPTGVEVAVAEMRRKHPRWGSRRIRMELLRNPAPEVTTLPAERTIDRILVRQGLLAVRPRKRPRESYRRFERPGPMQLWGIDIVGGIQLVDVITGVVREAKLVTGVDDHSRFCVMASVVERATSRAVCLAFAQALVRFGSPHGLAWEDVDLGEATARIGWQLQRVNGGLVRRATKTYASDAPLPLPDICIRSLEHRRQVEARYRSVAPAWHDSGLVLTTRLGTPVEPRNFHRAFVERAKRAGVPVTPVHLTRKACASLLVALDVHPRVAMQILRHSKIAVTMEVYAEVVSSSTQDALRRLGEQLDSPDQA